MRTKESKPSKASKALSLLLMCLLVSVFAVGLTACGSSEEETKTLSVEELTDIAFADAGFDISAGSDILVSKAVESGTRNVSFKIGDAEYSYDIDVNSGEIVKSIKPDDAPDVDTDPVGLAMSKMGTVHEFAGASNIKAKKSGQTVIITFDNNGKSFEYHYDIESGELSKKA